MRERIEVGLRDVFLVYDGTILELFDQSVMGSARYWVTMLKGVSIDDGMLRITSGDTTTRIYPFAPEQGPGVAALIAAMVADHQAPPPS